METPATAVGRANGMSTSESRRLLPGKRYLSMLQARIKPNTRFMSPATSAARSESPSALRISPSPRAFAKALGLIPQP